MDKTKRDKQKNLSEDRFFVICDSVILDCSAYGADLFKYSFEIAAAVSAFSVFHKEGFL